MSKEYNAAEKRAIQGICGPLRQEFMALCLGRLLVSIFLYKS